MTRKPDKNEEIKNALREQMELLRGASDLISAHGCCDEESCRILCNLTDALVKAAMCFRDVSA